LGVVERERAGICAMIMSIYLRDGGRLAVAEGIQKFLGLAFELIEVRVFCGSREWVEIGSS